MNDVALLKPYPTIDALAVRLIAEDRRGGVRLLQWREGYPRIEFAERIELKSEAFIVKMLSDAYKDDTDYRPTVQFIGSLRAEEFAIWIAGQ